MVIIEKGRREAGAENVTIDIEEQHQGPVMEQMGVRKGRHDQHDPRRQGRIRLEYLIPGARPDRLP